MSPPTIMLVMVWLCSTGALALQLFSRAPLPVPPAVVTGAAEVSDLLARLRPLAKEPDGRWYSNGLTLQFSGADVRITLKTPEGNEYVGAGNSLDEAVARLTAPSTEIKAALQGWKP